MKTCWWICNYTEKLMCMQYLICNRTGYEFIKVKWIAIDCVSTGHLSLCVYFGEQPQQPWRYHEKCSKTLTENRQGLWMQTSVSEAADNQFHKPNLKSFNSSCQKISRQLRSAWTIAAERRLGQHCEGREKLLNREIVPETKWCWVGFMF